MAILTKDVPVLSRQVLALYDPWGDRYGELAARELFSADQRVVDAFCSAHFNFSGACKEAAKSLSQTHTGQNVTVHLLLTDIRPRPEQKKCEIAYTIVADFFSGTIELDEAESGESFGQVCFLVANPKRIVSLLAEKMGGEGKSNSG